MDPINDAPKAYRLFFLQVESVLESGTELLKQIVDDKGVLDLKSCETVVVTFHTLRGGAGFFNLKELAKAAEKIEKVTEELLNGVTKEDSLHSFQSEALSLFQDLKGFGEKIPKPPEA
jgi:chemotaxis protein histidine kinase CheA